LECVNIEDKAEIVMQITDSGTGRPIAQVAIGGRPDAAAYDASSGTAFASNPRAV
jgi:hypothetical protein